MIENSGTGVLRSASRAAMSASDIEDAGVMGVNGGTITCVSVFNSGPVRNGIVDSDDAANHVSILNERRIETFFADTFTLQRGADVEVRIVSIGQIESRNEAAIPIREDVQILTEIVNSGEHVGHRAFDGTASHHGVTSARSAGSFDGSLTPGAGDDHLRIESGIAVGFSDLFS